MQIACFATSLNILILAAWAQKGWWRWWWRRRWWGSFLSACLHSTPPNPLTRANLISKFPGWTNISPHGGYSHSLCSRRRTLCVCRRTQECFPECAVVHLNGRLAFSGDGRKSRTGDHFRWSHLSFSSLFPPFHDLAASFPWFRLVIIGQVWATRQWFYFHFLCLCCGIYGSIGTPIQRADGYKGLHRQSARQTGRQGWLKVVSEPQRWRQAPNCATLTPSCSHYGSDQQSSIGQLRAWPHSAALQPRPRNVLFCCLVGQQI